MGEKLTEGSRAVRLLRKKFASGDIAKDAHPKQIHESNNVFRDHKLDNFRTKFNKLKSEYSGADDGTFVAFCFNFW